jgi:hypothetical protein
MASSIGKPIFIVSILFVIFIFIAIYSYYSKRSPIVKLFLIIHLLTLIAYANYLVKTRTKEETFRSGGGGCRGCHRGRSRSYGGSYGGGDWWSYNRQYGWNYGWPFYNSEECYNSAGVIVCERPKPYFYLS